MHCIALRGCFVLMARASVVLVVARLRDMVDHMHDIACVPVVLQTLVAVDDTKRQVNASLAVSACEFKSQQTNTGFACPFAFWF